MKKKVKIGGAAQSAVALSPPLHRATPGRAFQVLIVEDSPIVSGRLAALISRLHPSIKVAVTNDGLQAMPLFEELRPDAVVLDIELPGSSGFDLLAQFKLHYPACVVIMLTTYAYPEFRENARRLGADHFFDKAMEFEQVTRVLAALAARPNPAA